MHSSQLATPSPMVLLTRYQLVQPNIATHYDLNVELLYHGPALRTHTRASRHSMRHLLMQFLLRLHLLSWTKQIGFTRTKKGNMYPMRMTQFLQRWKMLSTGSSAMFKRCFGRSYSFNKIFRVALNICKNCIILTYSSLMKENLKIR